MNAICGEGNRLQKVAYICGHGGEQVSVTREARPLANSGFFVQWLVDSA